MASAASQDRDKPSAPASDRALRSPDDDPQSLFDAYCLAILRFQITKFHKLSETVVSQSALIRLMRGFGGPERPVRLSL